MVGVCVDGIGVGRTGSAQQGQSFPKGQIRNALRFFPQSGELPCDAYVSLTEAVWQACRLSPTIGAFRDRVQRDDPQRKKIAVVATAHYLVRVMWSMLRHQRTWQERRRSAGVANRVPP